MAVMASQVPSLILVFLVVWSAFTTVWVVIHKLEIGRCKTKIEPTPFASVPHHQHSSGAPAISLHSATPAAHSVENRLQSYSSQIFYWSEYSTEKCTLVLLIREGKEATPLLKHYCGLAILKQIFLVWNTVGTAVSRVRPFKRWAKKCKSKLTLVQPPTDKLTNRYLVWQRIDTDCVYLADEGQYPTKYSFLTAYEAWRNSRHLLVGYQESSYLRLPNNSYVYTPHEQHVYIDAMENMEGEIRYADPNKKMVRVGPSLYLFDKVPEEFKPHGYSIMSTPCFVHKSYLQMFFDPLMVPAGAVQYVEELGDCEDILLSAMVTKFLQDSNWTQDSGVLCTKGARFGNGHQPSTPNFYSRRSQCLNKFSHIYGYLPLQLSNTMVVTY